MRAPFVAILAFMTFGMGLAVSPVWHAFNDLQPEGHGLDCVARGGICAGMDAKQAIFRAEENLGGLTNVGCDFDKPEFKTKEDLILIDVIQRGCPSSRYLAVFSDGRHLTGLWIENGKVTRLDRGPAQVLDF